MAIGNDLIIQKTEYCCMKQLRKQAHGLQEQKLNHEAAGDIKITLKPYHYAQNIIIIVLSSRLACV